MRRFPHLLPLLTALGLSACGTTAVSSGTLAAGMPFATADEPVTTVAAPAETSLASDLDAARESVEGHEKDTEQVGGSPWHGFRLTASAMIVAQLDTTIRADSDTLGRGTEIAMEDLLGLDDSITSFRLDAMYRFDRANMLGVSWFDIDRTGRRSTHQDVQFEDETFSGKAEIHSELDTSIYRLNYWWNFAREQDWEAGVGVGVYWMNVRARLAGRAAVAGGAQASAEIDEEARVNFPPPLVGLRGAWAITPSLRLEGSVELMYVPIDRYKGWMLDTNVGFTWDVFEHVGLGLSYNFFSIGVRADAGGLDGRFEYRYQALLASLYLYF